LNYLQQSLWDFSLTHFPFLQNYFWHPHVKKDQMHRDQMPSSSSSCKFSISYYNSEFIVHFSSLLSTR
jgi:hypothetical protein